MWRQFKTGDNFIIFYKPKGERIYRIVNLLIPDLAL